MFGPTTTLMVRSLREDSRLMRGHLLRLFLLGILLWALSMAQAGSTFFGAPGLMFFSQIITVNFLFISLAGVSYFSTAITEEKEEMTLGLLKMAGVGSAAILLGKSGSRIFTGILLLSVQFPFTLLAITLGGVTPRQVVAAYVALLAYLLLVGNLALLSSVVSARSRSACWLTGLGLFSLLILPPMASSALAQAILDRRISETGHFAVTATTILEWLKDASIGRRMELIAQTGFSESIVSFQVVTNTLAAGVLFGLSWGVFPLFTRNEVPIAESRGPLFRRILLMRWLGTGRAWLHNPLTWKDFHFVVGGKSLMLLKFVLYGAALFGSYMYIESQSGWRGFRWKEFGDFTMVVMLIVLMVELALYAGRVFRDELQARTLPTVMMLPLTVPEIIYPKIAGCLLGLAPAASYFMLGSLYDPQGLIDALTDLIVEPYGWFMIVQYILFLHLAALLSLIIKWGAVPLAFAIVLTTNMFCISTAMISGGGGEPDALFFVLSLLGGFIIFILHMLIGQLFRNAAAK